MSYPTLIVDGNYTTAKQHGPSRLISPFAGQRDDAVYIIEEDFWVYNANFSPLALNTAHAAPYATFVLVADGLNPQPIDGDIRQFTRRWAKVPANRTEFESYPVTFPGLTGGSTAPIVQVKSASYDADTGILTVETIAAHGLAVDDFFLMFYTSPNSSLKPIGNYPGQVGTVIDGTHFSSAYVNPGVASQTAWGVQKFGAITKTLPSGSTTLLAQRASYSVPVMTFLKYEYFLIETDSDVIDIPLEHAYLTQIIDKFGVYTNILDVNSTPGLTDYVTLVSDQNQIVVVDSDLHIWEGNGNILEKVTRYAYPQ